MSKTHPNRYQYRIAAVGIATAVALSAVFWFLGGNDYWAGTGNGWDRPDLLAEPLYLLEPLVAIAVLAGLALGCHRGLRTTAQRVWASLAACAGFGMMLSLFLLLFACAGPGRWFSNAVELLYTALALVMLLAVGGASGLFLAVFTALGAETAASIRSVARAGPPALLMLGSLSFSGWCWSAGGHVRAEMATAVDVAVGLESSIRERLVTLPPSPQWRARVRGFARPSADRAWLSVPGGEVDVYPRRRDARPSVVLRVWVSGPDDAATRADAARLLQRAGVWQDMIRRLRPSPGFPGLWEAEDGMYRVSITDPSI